MKRFLKITVIVFLSIGFIAIMQYCTKPTAPVITTVSVSGITQTSATSGGNVTDDGGSEVTARGVCWGTSQNPTTSSSKTSDGKGTGSFTSSLTQLTPGTTYYVKAYATNSEGTSYGNEVSFTSAEMKLATLTTYNLALITATTALSGGYITSDGGGTITACGVCWSTTLNPTTADTKTSDVNETGYFSSFITGLNPNTTYHVRAYAINSVGTSYGNDLPLTTQENKTVTDIEGNVYHYLAIGDQIWMTENLKTTKYNDGTAISYPGSDNAVWENTTTAAYAWYDNDASTYKGTYGALYNFHAVGTGNLCPTGWHAPSDEEWTTLTAFLGGEMGSGGSLKEAGTTHWESPNTGAKNQTGFTALPGGFRNVDGTYSYIGKKSFFWSSTPLQTLNGYFRAMGNDLNDVQTGPIAKRYGFSVRCVKNP
jgi:uncharacterized protein (TIGR02145 family)